MCQLVLWGYHADEYQEMFDLSQLDLKTRLLEYGCGPSAVNLELRSKAKKVVSCDPLFNLDKATLASKASLIFADRAAQIVANQAQFDFSGYGSPEALFAKRREGLAQFFADYSSGKAAKHYVPISKYELPFNDFTFDYALSAHYFFADLDGQDSRFHIQVIKELARVAKEVRIFPLIDYNNQPSPMLGPVLLGLQAENFGVEIRQVNYNLQPGGNAMLRVWAQQCSLD